MAVYSALLRSLKSSWQKKSLPVRYFYNLIFQLVSTTHAESLPSKTHCDSCLGFACDFHGSGGPGGGLVEARLLRFVRLPWKRVQPLHKDSADGALCAQGLFLWGFFKLFQESAVAPLTIVTFL